MERCEDGDAFVQEGDDMIFNHTKIILRNADDEYFYIKSSRRESDKFRVDINAHVATPIPTDLVCPPADPKYTRAPDPLPSSSYLKRSSLLLYEYTPNKTDYEHIQSELEACEVLIRHPHPNVAQYLGCVVKGDRVRGLVFTRYSTTLAGMLRGGVEIHTSRIMRGIEAGARHMHSLGLVHNDLNPSNIMVDGDEAIIIDFDSCMPDGVELGAKWGSTGYCREEETHSRVENDLYGISKIREELEKANEQRT